MTEHAVVVFGAAGVGKTACIFRYIQSVFVADYDPTIEDCHRKQVEIDNEPVVLLIYDTAGQEDLRAIHDTYYRRGQGFILVYSVIDRDSFNSIDSFLDNIARAKDVNDTNDIPVVVVGNKCDLELVRAVSADEAQERSEKRWKHPTMEVSALKNINIMEMFVTLVRLLKKAPPMDPSDDSPFPVKDKRKPKMSFPNLSNFPNLPAKCILL